MSQLFASGGQSIVFIRIDGFDLLTVQETVKSLLQHHSSKASILRRSAFFIVQLSHPYMTTGKAIALTRRTFVGKVTCLLFNMLSRLVISFLPTSLFMERKIIMCPLSGHGETSRLSKAPSWAFSRL